jgi:N-acetylmuramoyl-L-alanine amidase
MKKKILLLLVSAFLGIGVASAAELAEFENISTGNQTPYLDINTKRNMLILNWSGFPVDQIVKIYQTNSSNASNHFVTGSDRIVKMIEPTTHASWAAGGPNNKWGGITGSLNQRAVSITMSHPGFPTIDQDHGREFVAYDENLFTTTALLTQKLSVDYSILPQYVLGHGDVGGFADGADQCEIDKYGEATPRKHAPGPLFPWGRLHNEYNVGAWLTPEELETSKQAIETADASELLTYMEKYGYPVIPAEGLSPRNVRSIKTAGAHFWSNIDNGETGADYDQLPTDYRDATAWMYGLVQKYVRS